ncbi:hypothetical protein OF83DRAFT_1056532 [Amylostereum chailletii]|nr:hypothetical protein OF83DRAFT_1056532 [Amylostereum chailletii]
MDAIFAVVRTCLSTAPAALSFLPRLSKYFAFAVLVLNARSLPFLWHVRLLWPVVSLHTRFRLFRASLLFRSTEARKEATRLWLERLSPVGENPLTKTDRYSTWADLSDSDYNMHLSNSSYAKNLDSARMRTALALVPGFLRAGGWIALGATHFQFNKEIPIFSQYEIRMTTAAWDNKWLFAVVRFVTKPKGKKRASTTTDPTTPAREGPPFPSMHTPASGLTTPLPVAPSTHTGDAQSAMRSLAAGVGSVEPDGAIVNCVSVNELVFKHGRITVPPMLVYAFDGMCIPAPDKPQTYSHANPPPHWENVRALKAQGERATREFLRGGWRDVPEGERWWEQAFAGGRETIAQNLARVRGVREGVDGAKLVVGDL